MELDYIENVNGLEEHVVRLYNFDMAEAILFRTLLIETIIEQRQQLDVLGPSFALAMLAGWIVSKIAPPKDATAA